MFIPFIILLLLPCTLAISSIATHYGGNLHGGNCGFASYDLPPGIHGTALAGPNWNTAAQCGACLRVTGPGGNSIKVMVVDQCPGCQANQLDLFSDAFSELAPLGQGIINVDWEGVGCGLGTPLLVRSKEGASKWWFSMQVTNANYAVTGFEISTDGGQTWQGAVRRDYNYFEKSGGGGFGTETVAVRVSCVNGAKVTLWNVNVNGGAWMQAAGNC